MRAPRLRRRDGDMTATSEITCGGMTRRWRAVGATAGFPRGFTLTEMLIVIGIIVLIVALAVPAFRAMTGGRSVDAAQNQLAAILGQARAEAIGLQKMRGVLFILDPATERVNAVLVEDGGRPDPQSIPREPTEIPDIYLDAVADRDPIPLPVGVGLQMVDNAFMTGTTTMMRADDGYIGYNLPPTSGGIGGGTPPARQVRVGGVILFDGNGRLLMKRYGFRTGTQPGRATSPTPTRLGELLGHAPGGRPPEASVQPQTVTGAGAAAENRRPPRSQLGFVLYDAEPFKNLNYTPGDSQFGDGDAGTYSPGGTTGEAGEEKWLDSNAFPVLVNRYNGTLVRGE